MGWTVRGSYPGGGRDFPHPVSCAVGTGSFLGVKSGRGMTLTPHPILVPWSRVELYLYSAYGPYSLYRASVSVQYSYTSTPPMGHTACTV